MRRKMISFLAVITFAGTVAFAQSSNGNGSGNGVINHIHEGIVYSTDGDDILVQDVETGEIKHARNKPKMLLEPGTGIIFIEIQHDPPGVVIMGEGKG